MIADTGKFDGAQSRIASFSPELAPAMMAEMGISGLPGVSQASAGANHFQNLVNASRVTPTGRGA